jgi:starch-binding outer membrane protein, SusD/RagB family
MGSRLTMTNTTETARARPGRPAWTARAALVAALALPLAACDGILDITDPDVVTPEQIRDPNNMGGLRLGALGDFMVAYGGNSLGGGRTEGIVLASGLLADELYVSDTFGTRREVDERRITPENSSMEVVFRNLHRARRSAEIAAGIFAANSAHDRYSASGHAEMLSVAAYTYAIFSENYCSGVPFSSVNDDDTLDHSQPWTTQQMWQRSLDGFGAALAVEGASATQRHLANVGRARVLLLMGQFEQAAEAAASVPTGFVYEMEFSENTLRQNNGVWSITHDRRGFGVSHREGGNGAPFRQGSSQDPASQDPRVPYTRDNNPAIDRPYAHFIQLKYPDRASAMPLATGIEARLIEAEAALRSGEAGLVTFAAKHNELRALVGLPAVAVTDLLLMTQSQRVDLHFQERAFWLFLTGQRLSDLRRLARQYQRNTESVFPTGTYMRPSFATLATPDDQLVMRVLGTYGPDVNFPVPFDERNNPNFAECLDRNP